MDGILYLTDFVIHFDDHLNQIIQDYGVWVYLILFVIVFLETGIVVTPFLPGDSLLFAAGTFAAIGSMDIGLLFIVLTVAAILGDSVNYTIGKYIGPKVFRAEEARFLKKEYLERTRIFYEKHGNKTIILARFVPIIRTFAPFLAGIGRMKYSIFIFYNVLGGVLWVVVCLMAGYFFGNIPIVRDNFSVVVLVIVVLSLLPVVSEVLKHRMQAAKVVK